MNDIYAYSDSTIVLAWLDGSPQRYKIYVANRIAKTISLIPPKTWSHVPTSQNPADCASRGITAKDLVHHPLWWHGPLWLQQEPLNFPPQPAASRLKQLQDTEAKPHPQLCNVTVALPVDQLETRSSSLLALIKVTCWIQRFMARVQQKNVPADLVLSRAEGAAAEDFLRKRSQARSFQAELQQLKATPPKLLSTKSSLPALHPYLDKKQLLRLGGRLNNSSLPEEQKHPIILSSSDTFSRLLLHHYHLQLSHCGPTALISHSGNLYHIIEVRRLARSVCSSCIVCRRVIGRQRLTYDELETVVCQAEACMNSRQLGAVFSHKTDGIQPMTPGHFLTGRALRAYPVPKAEDNPTPLQRWILCQQMGQHFWKRWSQEYLQQMQRAVKWHKRTRNHQMGDLVMLTDGNVYQCQWTMARVVAVHPGQDGIVRAVDVQVNMAIHPKGCTSKAEFARKIKTRTAVYRRPIHKLAMLLAVDEVPEITTTAENP